MPSTDVDEQLRHYISALFKADRKWRDFYAGVIYGLKEAMDIEGRGAESRAIIREALESEVAKHGPGKEGAKRLRLGMLM